MTIPSSEPIFPEPGDQSFPDSRRQRDSHSPSPDEGRGSLRTLLHLATPSFDYYLGFLLVGIIAAAAMLLDAPALYLLAVLFTPFLGPVYGLPLAAAAGSGGFFIRSLVHLTLGGGLIFGVGALAGLIGANLPAGDSFGLVELHLRLAWSDLFVLAVGAGLTTYLLVRSPRQKPLVANVAVAYGLVLPLAASGFFLTASPSPAWSAGLIGFGARLALAVLVSAATFAVLGLRPASLAGYTLALVFIVIGAAAIFRAANARPFLPAPAVPSPAPSPTMAPIETATSTVATPMPPVGIATPVVQKTPTPTETLFPSATATATVTTQPTPVWAKIDAPSGGGAFIRAEPGGTILTSLLNGSPVMVISEPMRVEGGAIWVQVRTQNGVEGWILQSLLATATPSPGW